jgi:hypothetical protein
MAKAWSSKRFTFTRPDTQARVDAIIVRLPSGSGSSAYWAFATPELYGQCDVEYVTDLEKLAANYGYIARHPMAVAPCDGTIYDPLRLGVLPDGAWVRGEVVQGPAIRPPISIRVQVKDRSIIADRIE